MVSCNLATGRWQRATGTTDGTSCEECLRRYIRRVAATYEQEQVRVTALECGHRAAWIALCRELSGRAYRVLTVRLCFEGGRARDLAEDFAQMACERIFRARFPYDVPFDAWATRILVNCIANSVCRSHDLMDRGRRLDVDVYEVLEQTGSERNVYLAVIYSGKLQAMLDHLESEAQRQVIRRTFVDRWHTADIAAEMGKSVQAVYNLRFRALRSLKHMLNQAEATY